MQTEFLAVVGFWAAGAVAGALARVLLSAVPRGMPVRAGPFEVATAALWALVASADLPGWWVPTACALTWVAVPLVAVDLRHRRLPDALTLGACPLLAVTLVVAAVGGGGVDVVLRAALGAGLFFVLHALLALAMPGALGGGDVKLAVPLGAVLGVLGPTWMLVALVSAAVVTLALIVIVPRWRTGAPHGPGLLGATCALVIGVGVPGSGPATAPRLPGADVGLSAPLAIHGVRWVG